MCVQGSLIGPYVYSAWTFLYFNMNAIETVEILSIFSLYVSIELESYVFKLKEN